MSLFRIAKHMRPTFIAYATKTRPGQKLPKFVRCRTYSVKTRLSWPSVGPNVSVSCDKYFTGLSVFRQKHLPVCRDRFDRGPKCSSAIDQQLTTSVRWLLL